MQPASVVFLLDVDNTLLDNDRIIRDLKDHLTQAFGVERQERYWAIFEKRRKELGYADYLGAFSAIGPKILVIRTSSTPPSTCWTIPLPSGCLQARSM